MNFCAQSISGKNTKVQYLSKTYTERINKKGKIYN